MKKKMLLMTALLCFAFFGMQSLQAVRLTFKVDETRKKWQGMCLLNIILWKRDAKKSTWKGVAVHEKRWGTVIKECSFDTKDATEIEVMIDSNVAPPWADPYFSRKIKVPDGDTTYKITDNGNWKFSFSSQSESMR